MTLHAYNLTKYPYHVSTSYTLQFPRYNLAKILKVKLTTASAKVKTRLHYDIAHRHSPTNILTNFQHPKQYSFQDTARTIF